jgi:hypothetical protein
LEWLDYGEPISDAVHAANLEVSNHFGGNPPHAFAMHLYGDPTYRCPYNPGNITEGSPQPRP